VRTTGVDCQPVCPVRPARSANVSCYPSAAAAEAAGFRPCLRCRPETAPFGAKWKCSRTTVERALRQIEQGALGGEGSSVDGLAGRVGIGPRDLARLFAKHVQASPSRVAKTVRVQRAKRLLDTTDLPVAESALRAGFASLRRFNAVFAQVYGRPPTEIRRRRGAPPGFCDPRPVPVPIKVGQPAFWKSGGVGPGARETAAVVLTPSARISGWLRWAGCRSPAPADEHRATRYGRGAAGQGLTRIRDDLYYL